MPIETITLELQNAESNLIRLIPFLGRKFTPIRWSILPLLAFILIAGGLLWTTYRLATINTYQEYVQGTDHVVRLVTVKESLFNIVFYPLLMVGMGLVYLAMTVRRIPMLLRKMKTMNPLIYEPFTLTLSEEGIQDRRNATDTKYQWDFVKTCYEKLGGLIIVYKSNTFHFIPAAKISEENYLRVRKILTEKIGISEI